MIPQIIGGNVQQIEVTSLPSKTWKETEKNVSGIVDKRPALVQSINAILQTERSAYPIYSPNFGVEFEQYIGAEFSYIEATIEDTIREALMVDDRIISVTVTNISQTGIDCVSISIDVEDSEGTFEMEYSLNV